MLYFIKCYNYLQTYFGWFIIIYAEFIFFFVLFIYILLISLYLSSQSIELISFTPYDLDYLPNYLKFHSFFQINKFLISNDYLIELIDYQLLDVSLDEIDYLFDENLIRKPIKFVQWHHLPTWSAEDEQSWIKICDMIMETGKGNFTHDFERFFLKYILGDPGFKNYMPPKYRAWRYLESFYIKYLLFELKNFSVNLERWIFLKQCVYNRLSLKKKGSYLFRCFDTYLNLYYTYEIVQHISWSFSLNKRITWMIFEYYRRRPWVIGGKIVLKFLIGVGIIYGWWPLLPFD